MMIGLIVLVAQIIILVIRTFIWATRMKNPIILNHPRVRQKPAWTVTSIHPALRMRSFLSLAVAVAVPPTTACIL